MLEFKNQTNKWLKRNLILSELESEPNLPGLPDILRQFEALLHEPRVNTGQVAALIQSDPVIAGRVLKLANSAYYGAGRNQIYDISMAVGRLGYTVLRNLVYSAVLPDLFANMPAMSHIQFWQHSFSVGLLARQLMELETGETGTEATEMAYLAGLMHDLGILVFLAITPLDYSEMNRDHYQDGTALERIEVEEFGVDHAELWALFIRRHWRMDERVIQAIRHHHLPPEHLHEIVPMVKVVYAANAICNLYNYRHGRISDPMTEHLEMLASLANLGMTQSTVENLLNLARGHVNVIQGILSN